MILRDHRGRGDTLHDAAPEQIARLEGELPGDDVLADGAVAGSVGANVEGVEVNVLGLVAGLDIRRPAVKLPGFGRIGIGTIA